jgi:hypothetical protein
MSPKRRNTSSLAPGAPPQILFPPPSSASRPLWVAGGFGRTERYTHSSIGSSPSTSISFGSGIGSGIGLGTSTSSASAGTSTGTSTSTSTSSSTSTCTITSTSTSTPCRRATEKVSNYLPPRAIPRDRPRARRGSEEMSILRTDTMMILNHCSALQVCLRMLMCIPMLQLPPAHFAYPGTRDGN